MSLYNGIVIINIGVGKDVLLINVMVGRLGDSRINYLVVDLGVDGNMLLMGVVVGIGRKCGNFVVGVIFDNIGG